MFLGSWNVITFCKKNIWSIICYCVVGAAAKKQRVIPKEKQSATKKEGKYFSKTKSVATRILYYKKIVWEFF
jgi:hypothetical protein